MAFGKYVAKPMGVGDARPFDTAQEAWFWYAQCQIARNDGVRFRAGRGEIRPCEPDDIYRAVNGLVRRRVLDSGHVTVLGRFGRRLSPPDPMAGDTPGEAALWDEALDRLTTVLRGKGIVS
jgi:hypothetical protein